MFILPKANPAMPDDTTEPATGTSGMTAKEAPMPKKPAETRFITVQDSARIASSESVGVTVTENTWANWLPNTQPKLTIDKVIDQVHARGGHDAEIVTVDRIRFWQRKGVLPAPIRRKPSIAKGSARALYPSQAVDAVLLILDLQSRGVKLRQINDLLRSRFAEHALTGTSRGTSHAHAETLITLSAASATRTIPQMAAISRPDKTRTIPQSATISVAPSAENASLLRAVIIAADNEAHRVGSPIRQVGVALDDAYAEVTFTDTRGRKHSHILPRPTNETED